MPFKAMTQSSGQSGPIAALSLGASMVQRSIERRFSLQSAKSSKSSQLDAPEVNESQELEIEGDRTPCFDLADDLEAGFMSEAFMAKGTTSPVQPKAPFRRCCIFHLADSVDEYHLLSESGDQMLTAKYIRTAARIEFFFPEEELKSPKKCEDDSTRQSSKRRLAFVMNYTLDRGCGQWVLKQSNCEHCMQRPKRISCEALGQGQQVAFIQHSLRPVGQAKVNYVDIRIPPVSCGTEKSVWCPVTMGRDLCGRSYSGSLGYSRHRRNSAPEFPSNDNDDLPKRWASKPEALDEDGSMSPPRSPTRSRVDLEVQPVRLHTKLPVWDEELESLVLSFKDRTVQSSPMNFMLRTEDNDSIVMQHAKMAANTFGLDYRYPLSTIQAFAVALTALSWD
mmetsp:Transcript_102700/g.162372  ORF Transcript_102700/g.162372 Transcript_102700/m.162372 type:complete len:393 (-) Transcript_102700:154-1332(-)